MPTFYHSSSVQGVIVARNMSLGNGWKVEPYNRQKVTGNCGGYGVGSWLETLMFETIARGDHYLYLDNAYFIKDRKAFYRASWDKYHYRLDRDWPEDRLKPKRIKLNPWNKDGSFILLCEQTPFWCKKLGWVDWAETTTKILRKYTDRPIKVRPKVADGTLIDSLKGAWAVVMPASNAGVDAAIAGVPVFSTYPSACSDIGLEDLSKIETPIYPDNRWEWLKGLSYNQWTLKELKSGLAWDMLKGMI